MKKIAWLIILLLFIAHVLNYLDRAALSIVQPFVAAELNLSTLQFSYIFSSFFIGYAIFNFLGGLSVDYFGAKWVLTIAVGLWSLFCGLTAVATGFYSMLILRVFFGIAEGPIVSAANKIVHQWFPKKQAATAMGILSAGAPLGGALSAPLVSMLTLRFSWRYAFVIIALLSFIWLIIWLYYASDTPVKNRHCNAQAIEHFSPACNETATTFPLSSYLKNPIIWATTFGFFSYNYLLFFFITWFPKYLFDAHHLNLAQVGWISAIPWILGFFGLILGGWISDTILKITGKIFLSRKIIISFGLLIASICVALAGTTQQLIPAILFMSTSLFFMYSTGSIYWAIIQSVVHQNKIGSVSGFMHFSGSIAGIIGPIITGQLVVNTGQWDSAFIFAALIAAISAIIIFFALRPPKPNSI